MHRCSFAPILLLFLCISSAVAGSDERPAVQSGLDVLASQGFEALKGLQVGLITNQTGRDAKGQSTIDVLWNAPQVKLVALFSPEHGIRGNLEHGKRVNNFVDTKTHLPVYSLYGDTRKPIPEMLNSIDVLVFDMQDVGTRFYTYLTTMAMAMEAAAARKIQFMVLDRPNPLGGEVIEGQLLERGIRHFTAYLGVPTRHGLTAGEAAKLFKEEAALKDLKLEVISMTGWRRALRWEETGLPFVPPSPNIKTPTAALLYAGIGMFEATNVSVGRGTEEPFERFGAPWINGAELAHRLNELNIPGFKFFQTLFVPTSDLYQGKLCSGVRLVVTDAQVARPVDVFVHVSILLREMSGNDYVLRWDEVARVAGSSDFEKRYKAGNSAEDILKEFHESSEKFRKSRQPYLLYP